MGADLLQAALARPDLPPKLRAFLLDVQRQARHRPLSPRQLAAVERIAKAEPPPDFAAVNRAACARAEDVCRRLLPGGAKRGKYWAAGDLSGAAGKSLRVNLEGVNVGCWIDNATGDKGGDFVSLAAAVARIPQDEAARQLARMLGVEAAR
ncbi:hypothetical protein [Falsiroseomonas oryzae]|uniref:hypothetical protein n=1 Tax=Falsiroseomonas oryzae TaxID=2766473 RepID=UPI0022EAEA8C|nr:hypothetical protein [Roseomonas sp. MO-31]